MSAVLSVIVYGLAGFAALAMFLYGVGVYNQLIFLARECDRSFANIDVLLKQRHDEIPNLVEICRGYAEYESSLFEKVTALRSRYAESRDDADKVSLENEFNHSFATVAARVENYPEIKASEQFRKLGERLTGLETSIAERRELYNSTATSLNEYAQLFPPLLVARAFGYRDRALLVATDAERRPVAL
jgi:LemA protein